ncbi:MAG: ATP-dependent DNA helicase RecG [Clostridia bacterium]|nr:ATP-dependent DNA helicase RecG [Clostridia bacterium]
MELQKLRGMTDKKISDLNKLGIFSVEDLARHFPRSYLDLTKQTPLKDCYHNDIVLTAAKVVGVPQSFYYGKRNKYAKVYIEQEGQVFTIVWFNNPYVEKQLKTDTEYLFYGRVQNKYGQCSLINPSYEQLEKNYRLKGIVPVYTVKGSIAQRSMKAMIAAALKYAMPRSAIPEPLVRKYALMPLERAYYQVHYPSSVKEMQLASERIALEEYFTLVSAFKFIKGSREQVRLRRYDCPAKELPAFSQRFGFEFTQGQKKAVNEIFADMNSPSTMNRLLQGDVGSGKTAVALCAMYIALKSGYQAAMLAPTEVLAKQNYNIIKKYLPEFDAVFLSGSVTAKEKREIKGRIRSGEAKVVVGTHAVLVDDVEFCNLNLCVCDEQHRFGVSQRNSLVEKGSVPDVLVMSATPIPRTLSLIFYGDLDISTISDKPKARAEIVTGIVPERKYEDMLGFIKKECSAGRQAYFICPLIEGDDEGSVMSATELYEELSEKLSGLKISLLHGKIKDKDKEAIMNSFKNGEADILVSTTVIEVGIDVPNATVMVIYNAERFGLSQLHQLRGRVGRSDLKSYCFLLVGTDNDKSMERLKILKDNSDGFKISEYDYNLRGSGDFMGVRQSGKFFGDLGALQYPMSVVFFAKQLSDETFLRGENLSLLRDIAMEKYEKLKDVTLN